MSDVVLLTGPTGYVGGRLRRLLEGATLARSTGTTAFAFGMRTTRLPDVVRKDPLN